MDKFYNLQTNTVEELTPDVVPYALGIKAPPQEEGMPLSAPVATHALLNDQKYEFFSPSADKYVANSPQDYLDALKEGALPWDPILEDAYSYKQSLRSGNFFTSAEKAKATLYKTLSGRYLGLPELGTTAYAAYQASQGNTADARATLLKKAILDEELGATGKVAEVLGMATSAPATALGKFTSKQIEKYTASQLANKLSNRLATKVGANIATRAVAGAVEAGGYTALEKTAQAFVPQSEDEFKDPELYAEHLAARLVDVPGQTLDSTVGGAIAGGAIRGVAELPGVTKAVAKSAVTPVWKAFTGIIGSEGKSLGDFADDLAMGKFIPRGSKLEELEESLGENKLKENLQIIKESWDKPGSELIPKVLTTANDTVKFVKSSLDNVHKAMNNFVSKVSNIANDFNFDDVAGIANKKITDDFGPKGAWTKSDEAIVSSVEDIIRNKLPAYLPSDNKSIFGLKGYTLDQIRKIKTHVDGKANWENKLDRTVSDEEEAYRIVARSLDQHIYNKLDEIGTRVADDAVSAKAYQDYKRAQSAFEMALDVSKSKANSMLGAVPFAISGAATGLLIQGLIGGDVVSPEGIIVGILGTALGGAYGRNMFARSLKYIHNNAIAGEMAINEAGKKFSSLTPQVVKEKGPSALRLLTGREIAATFGAIEPTKENKERYVLSMQNNISAYLTNQTALAEAAAVLTEPISEAAPQVSSLLQQQLVKGMEYLDSQLPKPTDMSALGMSEFKVSDAQVYDFNQKATAVLAPSLVIQNLQNGTATKPQLDALKAVYPKIYESIAENFTIASAENPKVGTLTKQDLGLVLNRPIATSMRRSYFKMLQENYTKQDGPGRPKTTSNMQSLGSMFTTETNRVANRNFGQ